MDYETRRYYKDRLARLHELRRLDPTNQLVLESIENLETEYHTLKGDI